MTDLRSGSERALSAAGRVGLAGRTGFYAVLVVLTARIAALGGAGGRQDNAHGALDIVSRPIIGKVAIGAVGLGFALFGIGRLYGAWRDRRVGRWRRATTALQGAFYLVLAYVPISFLAGDAATGSEQQQHKTTAELLGLPAGRELVIAIGVVVIVVCGYQVRGAVRKDFADGLDLDSSPRWTRTLVERAGVIGISARALVFLPIGVFFIVAAVQYDPAHAHGLDAELLSLSGHAWGSTVLAVVAAGLATFVLFSALETRYRVIIAGL